MKKKIFVALSGGVDSSVSAALLKEQGHDVTGIFMRNWSDTHCSADDDLRDVARICGQIDIPYYAVTFEKEYAEEVFADFLEQSSLGFTPNPDILCNKEIKFKYLFDAAKKFGADFLATGHYAQILPYGEGGDLCLAKGKDSTKDQSYFLYHINPKVLKNTLFPLGGLEKSHVRQVAKRMHLVTADKKDSTGICFIGKRKFREFLSGYLPIKKGDIFDTSGNLVGQHDGTAFYTVGQRKGLGIGGKGQAWFVIDKDAKRNRLYVSQGTGGDELNDCIELFSQSCHVRPAHWLLPSLQKQFEQKNASIKISAKIRYRSSDVPCTLFKNEDQYWVEFDTAQRAVTPGQSIVFYQDAFCLGGAVIRERSRENLKRLDQHFPR